MEPEGVVGVAGARAWPVGGEAPCREAIAAEDGVQHVPRGVDPGAVPDREDVATDRLSFAVMEPVAGRIPSSGGAIARPAVVLRLGPVEAGVWMPRSVLAPS